MINQTHRNFQWHAVSVLQRRDLRAILFSPGIFIAFSFSLLMSSLILGNSMSYIKENGLVTLKDVFGLPIFIFVVVISLYLALFTVALVPRERERGILQVLFYGPVDSFAYVMAKFLALTITYGIVLVGFGIALILYATLTNFYLPANTILTLVLSIFITTNIVSLSILISVVAKSYRTSLLLFLGILAFLIAVQIGYQILLQVPPGQYYDSLLFLKRISAIVNQVVGWLSPFSYLSQGTKAINEGNALTLVMILGCSMIQTFIFLWFSISHLEKKGVLQ